MSPVTQLHGSLPKRFSLLDEYRQHLHVSEHKRQKRRRSWTDQDVAHESMPHGKTYAILAAEGIVARAKQVLTEDDELRKSSMSSREE